MSWLSIAPGQDAIRVAVEPVDELAALVLEVAHDRRRAARLDSSPEALVEVGLAAVGRHRQLSGEGHALVAERVDEPQLDVVPGHGHRAGRGGRRDGQDAAGCVRAFERDLQRDHAAKGATGDEREGGDAEGIEELPLHARLVAGRDVGE